MTGSRPASGVLVALLGLLGGCVVVESTLRTDGSAVIELVYRANHDATEFLERRRFSSPHVHVESVKIDEDQRTVLRATVDDVTKLSTAAGFALVAVERARDGHDERLTIRLTNPGPRRDDRDRTALFRIAITLPGPVRSACPDAEVSGHRVVWTVARRDYLRNRETVLRVRYRPPPA
jgi:hypothetical protein